MKTQIEGQPLEKIMDVHNVASYLKLSERKIRLMVADKEIPYARVGGRIRFDRDEINRWFKMNSEKSKVS